MPAEQVADEGIDLDGVIAVMTNSLLQGFARELYRAALLGGLRDSRALRAAIRQIVSKNVRDMDMRDISKVASSVGLFPSRTGV